MDPVTLWLSQTSSLVIWALRQAGFSTGNASYTGDMSDELTARGWQRLPYSMASVRAGDNRNTKLQAS